MRAFWLTDLKRFLTVAEMLRLQGYPAGEIMQKTEGSISEHQVGQLLGNAMSLNVLSRILARSLVAAGLVDRPHLSLAC